MSAQPDILQALADMMEARVAAAREVKQASAKRWRSICGELYMMQNKIRSERRHTVGTGRGV